MSSEHSKSKLALGIVSGIVVGSAVLAGSLKRNAIMAKFKQIDRQLFEDGRKQADFVQQIKRDVDECVKQA